LVVDDAFQRLVLSYGERAGLGEADSGSVAAADSALEYSFGDFGAHSWSVVDDAQLHCTLAAFTLTRTAPGAVMQLVGE
jgi:hypothetical protein